MGLHGTEVMLDHESNYSSKPESTLYDTWSLLTCTSTEMITSYLPAVPIQCHLHYVRWALIRNLLQHLPFMNYMQCLHVHSQMHGCFFSFIFLETKPVYSSSLARPHRLSRQLEDIHSALINKLFSHFFYSPFLFIHCSYIFYYLSLPLPPLSPFEGQITSWLQIALQFNPEMRGGRRVATEDAPCLMNMEHILNTKVGQYEYIALFPAQFFSLFALQAIETGERKTNEYIRVHITKCQHYFAWQTKGAYFYLQFYIPSPDLYKPGGVLV